ncbi:hypothetical protein KQX54_004147 [Cotesia glomerata]|uniref:RING-type domain-containing protein n=1 Tax=Cotesia glomerata TaxID=32391 RepID=A0AAV7I565_COTGL|nr:hypothetical protein KQX54_004147 [Cotesia glomerata]
MLAYSSSSFHPYFPSLKVSTTLRLQLFVPLYKMAKGTPAKITPVEDLVPKEGAPIIEPIKPKSEPGRPASRTGNSCRVCLKAFKPDDFSRTCYECHLKVCDDCASYSETKDLDDPSTWRCSICRRKIASRGQPIVTQESTDSLLEVPVLEALQRRHSDARLSCQSGGPAATLGSGLAPPRSPELRRHSDVSPASLKELEKSTTNVYSDKLSAFSSRLLISLLQPLDPLQRRNRV